MPQWHRRAIFNGAILDGILAQVHHGITAMLSTTKNHPIQNSLSSQQIKEFHKRGWTTVEGVFNQAELQQMRNCFASLKEMAESIKSTQLYRGSQFVLSQKNSLVVINRVVWAGGAEPYLAQVGADPRLVNRAALLLENNEMDQLLNQAHFKMPGDGVVFDWHQDIQHRDKGPGTWDDVNGKGSYVQSILLVDEMTQENGPLKFIPGSSQWGRVNFGDDAYDSPAEHQPGTAQVDESTAVSVIGKAGTVVFFGPYTVHGSFANTSKVPRRILINGYASPGANHRVYPGEQAGRRLVSKTKFSQ